MPSAFAYLALLAWPAVVLVLFQRLSVQAALAWSIVGGYLLLPLRPTWNFPLLPEIDRGLITVLSAALFAILAGKRLERRQRVGARGAEAAPPSDAPLAGWIPKDPWSRTCLALLVGGAFMTVLMNGDRLFYGRTVLPALRLYDGFSMALGSVVMIAPLLLARKYMASPRAHLILLSVLCLAALGYSLLALYEVRMSPQLNRMVYGFFPNSWIQHVRGGGYRPLVFLKHGLLLGLFFALAIVAMLALMRAISDPTKKTRLGLAAAWLLMTLVLSKNLGSLMLVVAALPVLLFCTARVQLLVAAIVAGMVLTYPVLRGNDLAPTGSIVTLAESISHQRASSLKFRLQNEEILLEKANQRPLFGWGGWGRLRVYNEQGTDVSITDGGWIIIYGFGGWVRYLGQFGLLCASVILLAVRARRYEITFATSGLALALAVNLVDLIPNAGFSPITWMMAGALIGRLELGVIDQSEEGEPKPEPVRHLPFRRQFPSQPAAGRRAAAQRPPGDPFTRSAGSGRSRR